MPYRENDPKATDNADNRAQLERLAAAGLAKRDKLAADRRSDELAARTRATSTRFRERAWASPRKLRFVGFWLAACGVAALLGGLVTLILSRDLAMAIAYLIIVFIVANLSALSAIPVMILYAIHAALWQRRDAVALAAWGASLPFPMERFVETLSLDHTLHDVRVTVYFAREVPETTVLEGLVGNLENAERVKIVAGERGCAFFASSLSDGDDPPNDVAAFVRELATKVLLPLHAVHDIERTTLDEADASETWNFGEKRDKLLALMR